MQKHQPFCVDQGRAFTGAWIETLHNQPFLGRLLVAPSRARGLKQLVWKRPVVTSQVAPSRARGLKHQKIHEPRHLLESRLHGRVD